MRILEITESTRLPLRLVVGIVSCLCLGTVWLTTLFIQVSNLEKSQAATMHDVSAMKADQSMKRDEVIKYLHKLDRKVDAITVKLNIRSIPSEVEEGDL